MSSKQQIIRTAEVRTALYDAAEADRTWSIAKKAHALLRLYSRIIGTKLWSLIGQQLCVAEIEIMLGWSQSKTSQQLAVLRRANLVKARIDAKFRIYSPNFDACLKIEAILDPFRYKNGDSVIALSRALDFFNIMANPAALAIFKCISGVEKTVSEIVRETGIEQPEVSIHLGRMQDAGIASLLRQDGRFKYYAANSAETDKIILKTNEILLTL